MQKDERKAASLVIVGNLPEKTNYTFGNSVRGAKLRFADCEIKRIVILDTEDSIEAADGRSKLIRSILGNTCGIISVPCIDDFRVRAFQTLADELRRRDSQVLIVDITNGRRYETFDLIVATSICRVQNVIFTSVPQESLKLPYWELDDTQYITTLIRPFSQDRSLEVAAQFELIYYSDRISECVRRIRESNSDPISGYSNFIERTLTNAIMNYFSEDPDNLENALKRLSELHEGLAKRLDRELSGKPSKDRFVDIVGRINNILANPARQSASNDDTVDEDRLQAVMLGELFDFCRAFRNYLAHPYHRRIDESDVRLMIFATLTILEKIAAVASWLSRTRAHDVHSN